MRSPVHIYNVGKDLLILGEGSTQGIDDITLTAAASFLTNFSRLNKTFFFKLYYNGSNSFC